MLDAALGIITGPLGGALMGVLALLGVVAGWFFGKRSGATEGQNKATTEALKDAAERQTKGQKAVRDGRASGDSPDQRVRNNDGGW